MARPRREVDLSYRGQTYPTCFKAADALGIPYYTLQRLVTRHGKLSIAVEEYVTRVRKYQGKHQRKYRRYEANVAHD